MLNAIEEQPFNELIVFFVRFILIFQLSPAL